MIEDGFSSHGLFTVKRNKYALVVSHNRRMLHRLPQQFDLLNKAVRCWSEWWVLATVFSSGLHETPQTIVLLHSCNPADSCSCVMSLARVWSLLESTLNYVQIISYVVSTSENIVCDHFYIQRKRLLLAQVSYLCAVWLILQQKLHLSEMVRDSIQDDNQHTETDEFIKTQQDLPGGIIWTIQNSHVASSFGN